MTPLQVIILLLLVRLPHHLAEPTPFALLSPSLVISSFIVSQLLLALYVFTRARTAIRLLHQPSTSSSYITSRMDHLLASARWATIFFTALHLYLLGLPQIFTAWLDTTLILRHIPFFKQALYLAPALLAWIAFWTAYYFVEEANRQRSLPYRLATGLPAHEMPSLGSYLSMQLRHNFYLLIPILLVTLIQFADDYLARIFPHSTLLPTFATFATILILLLMTPLLITRIWTTIPLTGPLRTRLDHLAASYHLRFKNILIWKTHNVLSNAAILGYLPFSRYFLMTDALLETLTDQQLEAVFAHEVGHGVHRHLWWYLVALLSSVFLTSSAAGLAVPHLSPALLACFGSDPDAAAQNAGLILSLFFLAPFLALGFPFVSHRFEHQADYFAAQHMNRTPSVSEAPSPIPQSPTPIPPLPPTDPSSPSMTQDSALRTPDSPPGTELFISSLETIIDLAQRSRDRRGWMHPSINSRIALLRDLASNPLARKSFAHRMFTTRLAIILLALSALALTTYTTLHDPTPPTHLAEP